MWKINFLLKNPKTDIKTLHIPHILELDLLHVYYLSTKYQEGEPENSTSSSDGENG